MKNYLKQEILRLALAIIVLMGIFSLFGYALAGLSIGLAGYLGWSLYHLNTIRNWLEHPAEEPPDASGIWGEVYDGIYHLQRRDKEEKSRLKATIEYLQDSFSSLSDAVVMIDKRGHIEWSNKSAEKLLGLKYPKDQKQVLASLIRDPVFTTYFDQGDFGQYLEIPSPANDYITLQIHITYFGEQNKLLFARDVTNMIQLERMRQDFVANVSHELRTPLTVIRGYLETFQDFPLPDSISTSQDTSNDNPNNNPSNSRLQSAFTQMLGQTLRMESLVKDLLTLSSLEIDTSPETQEEINLGTLTASICNELFAAGTDNRTITNACPEHIILKGNPEEIRSAITNLLTNAIKYTEDNGEIWISWEGNENGGRYKVKDNGIGISEEHLPRLTERFYRVDKSRSVKTGGTGLGLAIVKHILIRHNASLDIQSELGIGSTFTCCFRADDLSTVNRL